MPKLEREDRPPRALRVSRRTVVKALGAVTIWPYLSEASAQAFAALQGTQAPPKLAFLTPRQYATLEALTETIIPTDEHSPGARAARVADYIDLLLAESDDPTQRSWTAGLALLDAEARRRYRSGYAELNGAQADALLTDISRNEASPRTPLEEFFRVTKEATIRGYYTSEIGIHKDLQYKGNQVIAEFVGCTHKEHGA